MTVAALTYDKAIPYVLADVLISILRTGQIPQITRVIRVAPWGQQRRSPVTLPTGTVIGSFDDPFAVMANDRARLELQGGSDLARGMLKGMTNALASGKTAQFLDDEPTSKPREQQIWDPLDPQGRPELKRFAVIEEPGLWYCPQAASGVTATARLLLTLSRLAFETAGGTIAYWDTDSLLVIATPNGGLVPTPNGPLLTDDGEPAVLALSYREVDEVRWRLEALSPYPAELRPTINTWDPDTGLPINVQEPRFLRVEPENHPPRAAGLPTDGLHAQTTSAKRYDPYFVYRPGAHAVLTDDGPAELVEPTRAQLREHSRIVMRGASRHGFTHQTPTDADDSWVDQIVAAHLARKLELQPDEPAWAWHPAISLIPITRPRIGRSLDAEPFTRLASWRATLSDTTAITYHHPSLEPDTATWTDAETHHPIIPMVGGAAAGPDAFIGDTYATAAARLRRTAEPTVITPDGQPCNATTQGIVVPAPTIVTGISLIGRESRRWRNHTPQGQPDHITYQQADNWPDLLASLRCMAREVGQAPLADAIGISERTLRNLLRGRPPSPDTYAKVSSFV